MRRLGSWVLVLVTGLVLVACDPSADDGAAGAREPGTATASSSSTATSAATSPATALTPVPTSVRDCGIEVLQQGARTVDEAARDCVRQAFAAGTPAAFTVTRPTIEGDPVTTRVEVLGAGRLRVSLDLTADKFSAPADRRVQTFECTSIGTFVTPDGARLLEVGGCAAMPDARFQI